MAGYELVLYRSQRRDLVGTYYTSNPVRLTPHSGISLILYISYVYIQGQTNITVAGICYDTDSNTLNIEVSACKDQQWKCNINPLFTMGE